MKLWWLNLQADVCPFNDFAKRQSISIGWPELETLEKQINSKSYSERRFKSYIQIKGDIAYARNPKWKGGERSFDNVPHVFTQLLSIEKGDLIIALELGNEKNFGRPAIRGIAQASQDAFGTYSYDKAHHHAHTVCPGTVWTPWQRSTMGELRLPNISFNALCVENSQLDDAWERLQKAKA